MNGNYTDNELNLNLFNVPPPNFNQRSASWNNDWKSNQAPLSVHNNISVNAQRSQPTHYSRPPSSSFQNNPNATNSNQGNMKYVNIHMHVKKNENNVQVQQRNDGQLQGNNGQLQQRSNGDIPTISVPPPPLPPYMGNSKTPMYGTTQHIYPNRLPTGALTYHGPVAYVPIPAPTHHSYYLPATHNPPLPPPPPPPSNHYSTTPLQRNFYYKRKAPLDMDFLKKMNNKKKKKPLSQNIPQRKDWSVEEAKRAIDVEKEYNKRKRSTSLIIKFPDAEVNRDIVAKFHPGIETVHFQQPSTPRFCFITLREGVNVEEVIGKLNKTRFGQGYLTVEYKKDREEDMNIGPEDIDPLTLYVGNLAQDVMKEDMVNIFPKHKRVDIGYAKKMKYTRYAFVSFRNVDDSIEAFTQTHSTLLYSKSLIVRFRRLHGTVGMPGEPKPQLPQKHTDSRTHDDELTNGEISSSDHQMELSPWDMIDVSRWYSNRSIKQEHMEEETDEENDEGDDIFGLLPDIAQRFLDDVDQKASSKNAGKVSLNKFEDVCQVEMPSILSPIPSVHISTDTDEKPLQKIDERKHLVNESQLLQNSLDTSLSKHLQQTSEEILEVKPSLSLDKKPSSSQLSMFSLNRSRLTPKPFIEIKKEIVVVNEQEQIKTEKPTLTDTSGIQVKEEKTDNTNIEIQTIHIKTEDSECASETQSQTGSELPLASVKDEPLEQVEEESEDDSEDEEDFNFGDLLSNLDDKTKKLKKLKDAVL